MSTVHYNCKCGKSFPIYEQQVQHSNSCWVASPPEGISKPGTLVYSIRSIGEAPFLYWAGNPIGWNPYLAWACRFVERADAWDQAYQNGITKENARLLRWRVPEIQIPQWHEHVSGGYSVYLRLVRAWANFVKEATDGH